MCTHDISYIPTFRPIYLHFYKDKVAKRNYGNIHTVLKLAYGFGQHYSYKYCMPALPRCNLVGPGNTMDPYVQEGHDQD